MEEGVFCGSLESRSGGGQGLKGVLWRFDTVCMCNVLVRICSRLLRPSNCVRLWYHVRLQAYE